RRVGLPPGNKSSIYENIQIGYGSGGFYFMEPGRYVVQAIFPHGDEIVYSNALEIWVRYPQRRVEDLVVPTFTREVAAYFATWGNPNLPSAVDALQKLIDKAMHSPAKAASRQRRVSAADRELANAVRPLAEEFRRCRFYVGVSG